MMKFRENEEAVSPVIGVILMVAITVILAAVIAAFVFGMTGNIQTTKVVSMQAKLDGGNITLTVNGGPDLSALQNISISHNGTQLKDIFGSGEEPYLSDSGLEYDTGDGTITGEFKVGDVISFEPKDGTSGRLLVVGRWADGTEQIILDRTF